MVLRDVCYGIEVRDRSSPEAVELRSPEAKHLEMFKRRAARGQYFHHPYLGCREFPASFELVDSFPTCPDALRREMDLGFMLQDIAFVADPKGKIIESNTGKRLTAEPHFFRAQMRDGVIIVPPLRRARA